MQHPNREHASRYLHVHIKAIWWGTTQCVWRSKLCYLKISFYLLFNRKWMDKPFKQLKQKELFKNSMNKCVCSIPVELKDQVMFRLKLFEALMDISRFLLAWKKKKKARLCYWAEEWNQSLGTNWLKMENLRDRPKKESARNWSKFFISFTSFFGLCTGFAVHAVVGHLPQAIYITSTRFPSVNRRTIWENIVNLSRLILASTHVT